MRIDLDKISNQYNIDRNSIRELLVIYTDITIIDCKALSDALQAKEWNKIKLFSHKLKSSFSYLMLDELMELCDLIKANRSNNIENIEPLVNKIFIIYKETIEEIKALQNQK